MSTVPESGVQRVAVCLIMLCIILFATAQLALAKNSDVSSANGGYIESVVWLDVNRDAIQDKSEVGLAGVSVSLLQCDGSFMRAVTTDANGRYHFNRLSTGCYRLRFAAMDGYRYCPANVGADARRDSDADPSTGLTQSFNVGVNEAVTFLDAGLVALSEPQIGDRVWEDVNADGVQDVGEPGLANVSVGLLDCSGTPVSDGDGIQRMAVTDSQGFFVFEGLTPACYALQISAPQDYLFSARDMTVDNFDSDADPASGMAQAGIVNPAQGLFNVDAGLYRTGTIGDWVWVDTDTDSQQGASEQGLGGVQVFLLDADGAPLGQTVNSDANGYYEFTGVTPGPYRLQFVLPEGYAFGDPGLTADPQLDSNVNALGISRLFDVRSGEQHVDIDVAARNLVSFDLEVEKLTNGVDADFATGPFVEVGGDVLWEYIVTNAGEGDLFALTISDSQGVSISCSAVDIPAGESVTCTGNTDDAQAGQYRNEVYACGRAGSPSGPAYCDKDPSHYFGSDPSISIEKSTNGFDADTPTGPQIPAGGIVNWAYVVRNTGNVTLTDVTVTDDQGVTVTCPSMTLDPGIAMTCTATGIAIAGQYANMGTVVGTPPVGDPVTDEDPSHYIGLEAAIDIEKATNGEDADNPTGPFIEVGGAVNWTYLVTNTGTLTLNDIVVTDSDDGVVVTCPVNTLEPGDSFTCTASGIATIGQYMNNSGVVGQGVDPDGDPVGDPVTDADPSHYFGADPAIDIEKATNGEDADTPTGPILMEGDDVTWTYVVTNTGNVTLTNVTVTDDQGVAVSCPADSLDPGLSFTCTGTGTAQEGQYANLGTVTGQGVDPQGDPIGDPVTDDDPSHYFVEPVLPASLGDKVFKDLNGNGQQDSGEPGIPGITVNLWTDDDGDGTPDTQIATTTTDANGMYGFTDLDPALTYVVQFVNDPAMNMPFTTPNVGDDATDSDAGPDGITGPITLESGENDPTIDAGLVNLPAKLGDFVWIDQDRDGIQDAGEPGVPGVTVNLWTDDDGDGLPDTQIATTTTDANGMYMFPDLNSFTIYVVQFATIPGKPFTVQGAGGDPTIDSNADIITGITGPITLASGEYNQTIDAGVIMLSASIDIEKATNGEDADTPTGPMVAAGSTVNWTYVVTNTGELTLSNVTVSDDQGVTVTCPTDILPPGLSFTCTASGSAIIGQYANLGSVTGQPVDDGEPAGDPVTDEDPSHYFGEAVCVDGFVADNFGQVSYGNNDGDMDWSSPWMENDPQGGGASDGAIRVENGMLVLTDYPDSGEHPSIKRSVDLSGYPAAMLMFDWSISDEANEDDKAVVEISTDGGLTFTVLEQFRGVGGTTNGGAAMYDISAYISADTVIRFRIHELFGAVWDKFMIDNVRIDKKCDECVPGDVSDHFGSVSYHNNDGSMDWSGGWHENDPQGGGASDGAIRVENGMLVLTDYPNSDQNPSITRAVDLSGYPAAMLMFDWSISDEANEDDKAVVEISSDGGQTFTVLEQFRGVGGTTNGGAAMYDISAYISADTVIRFRIHELFGAVWDKFMIDNVRIDKKCDPTTTQLVCTANETPSHAFYLANFNGDGVLDRYDLEDGATFVQNADGTAQLTGRIRYQQDPSYAFDIDVTLSGRTDTPPPGSPYNPYSADPSDWQYYPNWSGTLTGVDWNGGASLTITRRGASFQIGTGANAHDGEQNEYGGSGWFDWIVNSQPQDCDDYNDCIAHEGNGDINIRLECPAN